MGVGGLSQVSCLQIGQRGGAERGLPGLGAVRADTPAAPLLSKWPAGSRFSLPASVKGGSERSAARRGPQAWLPGLPGLPGFPLPRRAQPASPSPAPPGPSPPVPGPSPPPLSLPQPPPSPYCSFASSGHVAGCLRLEPRPDPPRRPRTRRPGAPGARARSPGSLAVADGATAPAGSCGKPGRS